MKRGELIRFLTEHGCLLARHGSRHNIDVNPANRKKQPVPRHNEIDEHLARHIKKFLGLEDQ